MKKTITTIVCVILLGLLLWQCFDAIATTDITQGQWTAESWAEYCEQDWR